MKATATEATERSIPAEDALRLVIDTTPTPIHTARPDGYIDLLQQSLAGILRQIVGGRSRVALD
jgi:hypothetical protein